MENVDKGQVGGATARIEECEGCSKGWNSCSIYWGRCGYDVVYFPGGHDTNGQAIKQEEQERSKAQ